MFFGIVAILATIVLAGCVLYLWKEVKKYRKRELEQAVLPLSVARDCVRREVIVQRELMSMLYYSCDNFKKHQQEITDKIAQMYSDGSLQDICANVIYLANLAESGALDKMAREYSLTANELRVCCYIHLGFRWQEICTADSITENAYSVRCSRIRKKLGLSKEERIPVFIADYCNKINSSEQ